MSDEQQKPSTNSGKRRRRRRPSRKRKHSAQPNRSDATSTPSSRSAGEPEQRSRRRRRRRKSRPNEEEQTTKGTIAKTDALDAKLPESIFVYTHVLRSSELDTYGFRPDPFLNSSRVLADFRIDLSPLFPDDNTENDEQERRIFDAALHGPIDTSVADTMDGDDEDGFADDEDSQSEQDE